MVLNCCLLILSIHTHNNYLKDSLCGEKIKEQLYFVNESYFEFCHDDIDYNINDDDDVSDINNDYIQSNHDKDVDKNDDVMATFYFDITFNHPLEYSCVDVGTKCITNNDNSNNKNNDNNNNNYNNRYNEKSSLYIEYQSTNKNNIMTELQMYFVDTNESIMFSYRNRSLPCISQLIGSFPYTSDKYEYNKTFIQEKVIFKSPLSNGFTSICLINACNNDDCGSDNNHSNDSNSSSSSSRVKGYFQIGSMVCEGHLRDKYIDKKEVVDDELKRNISDDNDRIKRLKTPFDKALSNKDFLLRSSTTTLLDDSGLLYSTG